ncbi:MAG: DUF3575 domain-containing protein [Bacteroidaceae bacterium]|nr:DUF3575 domain-containing protein [Bacteroidaceae bacterium]
MYRLDNILQKACLVIWLVATGLFIPVRAQVQPELGTICNGQITVSRAVLARVANEVRLNLLVHYGADMLKRNIHLSPQFRDEAGNSVTLPPQTLVVKDGEKMNVRNNRIYIEMEFKGRYQAWMEGASLCLATETITDSTREKFNVCLLDNIHITEVNDSIGTERLEESADSVLSAQSVSPALPVETVNYASGVEPESQASLPIASPLSDFEIPAEPDRLSALSFLSDTLEIRFKLDSILINMHFAGNMERWNTFERNFMMRFGDKNRLGIIVDIYSGASPEGTVEHNRWLGQERGESIKQLIERRLRGRVGNIVIHNEAARWQGLYDAVEASDEAWRDEVLDIIRQPASVNENGRDRREWLLRHTLGDGVWEKLLSTYLPPLRSGGSAIVSWDPARVAAIRDTLVIKDTLYIMTVAPTPVVGGSDCIDCVEKHAEQVIEKLNPVFRYPVWALKTNLPLLGTGTPNLQAEFSLDRKDRWSVNIEGVWSWWTFAHNVYANQIIYGGAELRYWLGKRWRHHTLDGWHIGLGIGGGYGDLEWTNRGFLAEVYSGFLNFGWQRRFGRRKQWAFDIGVGLGYAHIDWRRYRGSQIFPEGKEEPQTDHLMWRETGHTNWLGTPHFNISIGYVFPQKDASWRRERSALRDIDRNAYLQLRDSIKARDRFERDSISTAEKFMKKQVKLLPTKAERKAARAAMDSLKRVSKLNTKIDKKTAKAEEKQLREHERLAKKLRKEQLRKEKQEHRRLSDAAEKWSKTSEGKAAREALKDARRQAKLDAKAEKKKARLERKLEKVRARREYELQRHEERLKREMENAERKYLLH